MLIKSFSSKVWVLRSFLTDRLCLERHIRSINSFSLHTNKFKSQRPRPRPTIANHVCNPSIQHRFSFSTADTTDEVTKQPKGLQFDQVCDETLDSLTDYFEHIVDTCSHLKEADVNYSDGVLTVQLGSPYGTYVINRQTPNRQIWLSSPTSGPKRYDFEHGHWIYRHDGISLHQLLDREIGNIVKHDVDFSKCSYSGTQE